MKLTKEEKAALQQEIQADLPEFFSIFPPWFWLWLIEIALMMAIGGVFHSLLMIILSLELKTFYLTMVMTCCVTVIIPNALINHGKNILGIRLLQTICLLYILASSAIAIQKSEHFILSLIITSMSGLVIFITKTIAFQTMALHRKKMAEWGRERIKKNKAYYQKIIDERTKKQGKG